MIRIPDEYIDHNNNVMHIHIGEYTYDNNLYKSTEILKKLHIVHDHRLT